MGLRPPRENNMDHNDLKCFSEAYQIKALKSTICELEDTVMKVTKYCGEIKAMEKVISWVTPMVKDTSDLSDLMRAKRDLLDLIAKRDALLVK